MAEYFWEGSKIRLRPIHPDDWEAFHENDLDSEAARTSDIIFPPRSPEGTKSWAEKEAEKEPEDDELRLAIETLEGELVGSIVTYGCNRRNGDFHYGLAIFRDHWRKGYAREAVTILLRYYFDELRFQKVNAYVYAFNDHSVHFHENLGFQTEGRLRRTIYTNGTYGDEIIFGLTVEEFHELFGGR